MATDPQAPGESIAGADLAPEIRRFVRKMSEAWARHPACAAASPEEARRIADQVRAPWTVGGPVMAAVTEHHVAVAGRAPVRVRVYDPGPPGLKPAVVYLHGGGWTIFSLDTHDRIMREYAGRAGVVVAGIDYALSPEAKYPAALDEVCGVVEFLSRGGARLGLDPGRLVLAGDSAGANLSLAACLRMRDHGDAGLVDGLVLNYGVFDRHSSLEATARFGGPGYMLSAEEMERFWRNYLRDERDAGDPLVCPLRAYLGGLPPTLLVVPECDLLTEQSLELARRLREAGVRVDLNWYPGATHSFLEAVSIAPVADTALADTAAWLRARVARPES